MIDNLNYIISNGTSFKHFYNDGEICELFKLDLQENILWKKTFLESYHSQIATLNSDSKNVYFVNVNNIDTVDFTSGNSFIIINFIDETSLRISFISSLQATHNEIYLSSAIFSRDILDYISVRTLLYVHQDNVEDIPNKIYNNLQTAIDNQLTNEVIVIQEGGVCTATTFEVIKSVVIYCESNVTINGNFRADPETVNQDIRVYGNPVLNGDVYAFNSLSDTTMNVNLEFESLHRVNGYGGSPGASNVTIKARLMVLTGNGLDSDNYVSCWDIDCIDVTVDLLFSYKSNIEVTSMYMRNFNAVGSIGQFKLGETGGQYLINFINCSMDQAYVYFTDNSSNEVRMWNSFLLTDQTESIHNENGYDTFLYLYGKNGSNKPAGTYVEQGGIGEFKIETALELV